MGVLHHLDQRPDHVDREAGRDHAVHDGDDLVLRAHADELVARPALEHREADAEPHRAHAHRARERRDHLLHAIADLAVAHDELRDQERRAERRLGDQQPAQAGEARIGRTAVQVGAVAGEQIGELPVAEEAADDQRPRHQHPARARDHREAKDVHADRHDHEEDRAAGAERADHAEVRVAVRELDRAIDRGLADAGEAGLDVDDRADAEHRDRQEQQHHRALLHRAAAHLQHHEQDRAHRDRAARAEDRHQDRGALEALVLGDRQRRVLEALEARQHQEGHQDRRPREEATGDADDDRARHVELHLEDQAQHHGLHERDRDVATDAAEGAHRGLGQGAPAVEQLGARGAVIERARDAGAQRDEDPQRLAATAHARHHHQRHEHEQRDVGREQRPCELHDEAEAREPLIGRHLCGGQVDHALIVLDCHRFCPPVDGALITRAPARFTDDLRSAGAGDRRGAGGDPAPRPRSRRP